MRGKSGWILGLAVVSSILSAKALAETVALDYGNLAVIESTAPLGTPLKYVSGGNGLTGIADSWPVAMTSAEAADNYDHKWLQYDPPIIWIAPSATDKVFAIPGVDHALPGEVPGESLEFIIWGSNDLSTWEDGRITAIYRDGFDTADTTVGHSDDYTSQWSFRKNYLYFAATSGDHVVDFSSPGEGEIDSLATVVPLPAAVWGGLVLLGGLGAKGLRRKAT